MITVTTEKRISSEMIQDDINALAFTPKPKLKKKKTSFGTFI